MTESPTIIGRYHVERLIAHGGMGSLYLARDPAIDRLVAIKLLREGFEDDALRERFAREARATGRLRHPNIVTLFDIGEHEHRPFIAMEYVPGETLAQLIRRRAPLTIVEKLAILEDLCAGLHYAHSAGIVHRDIKPANVMLEDVSGTVKVLDFGIARAGESGLTNAGEMVGTLNYMSPEQIAGHDVDHRTDVYAVGVLAYELLSYRRAFPGTIQDGALFRILNSDPDPLELLVPDLDTGIEPVVAGAMAKEPAERYQDLEQLRQDLADVRDRLIVLGVGGGGFPAAALDADAVTTVAHSEGSGTAPRPTPTPGKTFRERPLSAGRGSSSIRRGKSGSASRARVTAPGTGRQIEGSGVSPGAVAASPRPWKVFVAIAVAAGLMVVVMIALNGLGSWSLRPGVAVPLPSPPPAAPSEAPTTTPSPTTTPAAPTTTPAAPVPGLAGGPAAGKDGGVGRGVLDDQLRSIRATARRQIAAGQRQQAIDTISAGLVLDRRDPELGKLIDVMARGARQEASQARAEASRLGITEDGSPDFRDARAHEQEADVMVRSGDPAAAIRAFWTASGLYERAGKRGPQTTPALPAPGPASRTETEKTETPRPRTDPPVPPPPAPANAGTSEKPLPVPPLKADPPPTASGDVPRDPQSADVAAIRDTLHRYAEAYASRSSAAVGKVMPSLGAPQLRALDRDFSNLRAYGVVISNERIVVDGATATVTCQVVRSFTTTTGAAGGNTVATVFTMRKTGGVWIIEKVGSR